MSLITRYVENGHNFLNNGFLDAAEGCLDKAYNLAKEYGFESQEEYQQFIDLFQGVAQFKFPMAVIKK